MAADDTSVTVEDVFVEAIYDHDATECALRFFPHAVVEDASDFIHTERVSVTLPRSDRDAFYARMIVEGYAECCLGFAIAMRLPERETDFRRWLDGAKALKAASA